MRGKESRGGGWLRVLLGIGLACGSLAGPVSAQQGQLSLEVTAPADQRSDTTLPLIEVKGRAGARQGRRHELMIVLDLSDSTVLASGLDLDGDGPDGGTDPELLGWLRAQPGAGEPLLARLQGLDLDDSILMAEVSAAEALIGRLDPRAFRVGIAVFSDRARVVAPLGSPGGRLTRALREIRRGFFEDLRGTNFADAIRVAHAELTPDPAAGDSAASRQGSERSILFLSDGAPTLPVHGDRARVHALQEARSAAAAGIRIYSFAIGEEAEEALEVYRRMAISSGGRFERISRPADAIARLPQVDLADLEELRVLNRSNGRLARALRVFPDGSFDGFVELGEGSNQLLFTARARDGGVVSVAREVVLLRDASGEAADRERALLEELRRRTRETLLWAEIERRRDAQKPEVEIEPERPEAR